MRYGRTLGVLLLLVAVTCSNGCKSCSTCNSSESAKLSQNVPTAVTASRTPANTDTGIRQASAIIPADNCNT
jgi:hypothetical protein